MISDIYYYKGKPLQKSYSNNYTPPEKLEIVNKINSDFASGMLSFPQMHWIIDNALFGSFCCMIIIDKLYAFKLDNHWFPLGSIWVFV